MIRTLVLTKEMKVFLAVTGVMSVVYLALTTGDHTNHRPKPVTTAADLATGKEIDVSITLITPDSTRLACASDTAVGNYHCQYKANGTTPWPKDGTDADKPENVLVPYMTADNVLFLVPGLWTDPQLVKRLADEPPSKSIDPDDFIRFNANCKLKVDQKMSNFKVRWQTTTPWGDRDSAWIGHASECKITDT